MLFTLAQVIGLLAMIKGAPDAQTERRRVLIIALG